MVRINVYGLGYVGCVTSLCLAKLGHVVTGLEVVSEKIEKIQQGILPIFEPGLNTIFEELRQTELELKEVLPATGRAGGAPRQRSRLRLVGSSTQQTNSIGFFTAAMQCSPDPEAEVMIVCVGTPSLTTGQVDLTQIKATAQLIGKALRVSSTEKIVILRSTVPPPEQ